MPNIDILPAQDDFIFSPYPFPLIKGGLGSGKTRGGTLRAVLMALQDKDANFGYYMPSYDLLELRAKPGIMEDLELCGVPYKELKARNKISIENHGDIIFRSYDRPERIVAYEVAHSVVDELDTIPKDKAEFVWRKISERNRQKTQYMINNNIKNSIGCVTTPDNGVNGFVYHKWEKLKQDGYFTYTARTYDNPFLPEDYIEQIKSNYDPILAELYLNGEYVSLSQNKVYHFFDRKKHHTDRVITDNDHILHIGVDFNIGGTTATIFILEDKPRAVKELVAHDTMDLCNIIASKYPKKKINIYPDASGKKNTTNATRSDIQILKDAGFTIYANNTNPPVRDRINSVNALFSHNKIEINTNECPELTFALESQGYDDRGEPEKFKDHPSIDDYNDNFGYFCAYRYPVVRSNLTSSSFIL